MIDELGVCSFEQKKQFLNHAGPAFFCRVTSIIDHTPRFTDLLVLAVNADTGY
jgi:hypothetical protein